MIQSSHVVGSSGCDKDTCNNCGKKGHWARDCPDKKTGGRPAKGGSRKNGHGPRKPNLKVRRLAPPKPTTTNSKKPATCTVTNDESCKHKSDDRDASGSGSVLFVDLQGAEVGTTDISPGAPDEVHKPEQDQGPQWGQTW